MTVGRLAETEPESTGAGGTGGSVPAWMEEAFRPTDLPALADRALAGALAGLAGAVFAALALGLVDLYSPLASLAAGLAAAGLAAWRWRALPVGLATMRGPWVLVMLGATMCVVALHVAHHGQHLVIDRDPGIYATSGLWMADNDSQIIDTEIEVFGNTDGLNPTTLGHAGGAGGRTLESQFPHGFPAVLALFGGLFGDGAVFIANPVLVGLAMLAIFAVAARFVGPLGGIAAGLAVGLNPVEAFFGRDTFSEILAQIFLWGGLWLVIRSWGTRAYLPPVLAGIVFGAAMTARLDAAAAIPALLAALGLGLLIDRHRAVAVRPSIIGAALVTIGVTAASSVAVLEARIASTFYYVALEERLLKLAAASIGLILVGAVVIALWPWLSRRLGRLSSLSRIAAAAAAVGFVGLGAFAWFVRPHVQTTLYPDTNFPARGLIEFLQRRAGSSQINGRRSYGEETVLWLEWYLGPLALAAGILGIGLALWLALTGRRTRDLAFVLLPVLAFLYLYIPNPRITPDLIWAMRRFLPIVIPGLLIAAVGLGAALALARTGRWQRLTAPLGVLLVLAVPTWQGIDVADERIREHHGVLGDLQRGCQAFDDDTALVIAQPTGSLNSYAENIQLHFAPALRSVCDLPTIVAREPLTPARLRELSDDLARSSRSLVVLGATRGFVGPEGSQIAGTRLIMESSYRRLRWQVESRPSIADGRTVRIWATRLPEGVGFVAGFGRGFHAPESESGMVRRWSRVGDPRLQILLSRSGRTVVELKLASFSQPRRVRVLLDGEQVGAVTVAADEIRRYVVTFEAAEGLHTLTLDSDVGPQTVSEVLGVPDPRSVALQLEEPVDILTAP